MWELQRSDRCVPLQNLELQRDGGRDPTRGKAAMIARWRGDDDEDGPRQAMDVEQLLSAGALHREHELAPVPPALKSTPKRFQLQACALSVRAGGCPFLRAVILSSRLPTLQAW